ncbi:MAG TPA: acyl carrier protein [Clostridiales bacterium]|nr:acyl carrier protein [Clostridiales bacterium]HPU67085.1 acyl carrier protein [Clostridiales bacterium]HQA05709.1 acyl carrier protein [Clostridiales bacterium]HQD72227.1 acyl carrier protein [Clostridiales bacterium]HXK83879.1 acyl carrier protein [Clostridiales bacterium]
MIYEKVVSIICDQLGLDEEDITLDSVLMDIVDDSIDLVELVKAFEDEFNIVVPDEEFENFTTVADVVKYLEEN